MKPTEFTNKCMTEIITEMSRSFTSNEEHVQVVEDLIDRLQKIYSQLRS